MLNPIFVSILFLNQSDASKLCKMQKAIQENVSIRYWFSIVA